LIKNFYILKEGGEPLFTENEGLGIDETLISGFLAALHSFSKELKQGVINKIDLGNHRFIFSVKDPILAVVEIETREDVEDSMYQIIAERLARSFKAEYQEKIAEWDGSLSTFTEFHQQYDSITSDITDLSSKSYQNIISQYFEEALTNESIVGMIIYDVKADEVKAKDVPPDFSINDIESLCSMLFTFLDRIGIQLNHSAINELLLRYDKYWLGGFKKGDIAVVTIFNYEFFGNILPNFITSIKI